MTDFVEEVENEVVSEARKFRKEAQSLTEELADLLRGKSGLDQSAKEGVLREAHDKAQEVVTAVQRALASV